MNRFLTKGRIAWLIILAVLVIDQVTDWCYIFFTENVGMAFGMEIFGKLFLTLFRLVAVTFIAWFLYKCVRQKRLKTGFIVCVSLILTGALGNIVDSVFYGVLFSQSTPVQLATFLLWAESTSSSSVPSSTLPTRPSVAGSSPCFCSTASPSMTLSIRL